MVRRKAEIGIRRLGHLYVKHLHSGRQTGNVRQLCSGQEHLSEPTVHPYGKT